MRLDLLFILSDKFCFKVSSSSFISEEKKVSDQIKKVEKWNKKGGKKEWYQAEREKIIMEKMNGKMGFSTI